jgi:hypothetical protein
MPQCCGLPEVLSMPFLGTWPSCGGWRAMAVARYDPFFCAGAGCVGLDFLACVVSRVLNNLPQGPV